MALRPRIAIPGRFTESASVLRSEGIVLSQKILEMVWAAGGDPIMVLPVGSVEGLAWTNRLRGIDGVLLPGGGDIDPCHYGGDQQHESIYGVNSVQDQVDISLVRHVLATDMPLLTICRGTQVLNVALGGTLVVDMPERHWRKLHTIELGGEAEVLGLGAGNIEIFCNHHQALDQLGKGLQVVARDPNGIVEAVAIPGDEYRVGVQWHPEDTWMTDAAQLQIIKKFVNAAR